MGPQKLGKKWEKDRKKIPNQRMFDMKIYEIMKNRKVLQT